MTQLEKETLQVCILECLAKHDEPMTIDEITKEVGECTAQEITMAIIPLYLQERINVTSYNRTNYYFDSFVTVEWLTDNEYFHSLTFFQRIYQIILDKLKQL